MGPHTRSFLAGLGLVSLIATAGPAGASLEAARDLMQDGLWLAHAFGAGTDLEIAVYEPEACVNRSHPDFEVVTFLDRIGFDDCDPFARGGHSTGVTSMLATARWIDGQREVAGLFGGRIFDVDSLGGRTEMLARDPDFINISATTDPIFAYWMDEAVYTQRIFIANGSGNDGSDLMARCFSYNSLCVGGYHHRGTIGLDGFDDDWHQAGARGTNDPITGREEPDLVGPFHATGAHYSGSGHEPLHGTSFATPAVVGLAALLTASYPTELRREPTLLRSLLMTSASHPVRDRVSDTTRVPDFDDGVDDYSGAGVPRGDRAREILENGFFFAERLDRDTDFDAEGRLTETLKFRVNEGETVRATLNWDNCPMNQSAPEDVLVVDLDMTVRGPNHQPEIVIVDPVLAPEDGTGGGDSTQSGTTGTVATTGSPTTSQTLLAATTEPTSSTSLDSTTTSNLQLSWGIPTVVTNHSRVDNYEIVEFVAPVGGDYYVEIRRHRWDVCPYDGGTRTHVAVTWDVIPAADVPAMASPLMPMVMFICVDDADCDGAPDGVDNCPAFANPSQDDRDADGRGDGCECGDQNEDGRVDILDILGMNEVISGTMPASPLCDADGDGLCDIRDILRANAGIFGAPTHCERHPESN